VNELERSLAFVPNEETIRAVRALPVPSLPKISVVIPSLNQARFLLQTLDSVIEQGYPRLEVFVADGGSTDGTPELLREYSARSGGVLRYTSAPDGGQQFAVNNGIAATDGEIIAWINSDDVYLPGAFWKVASFFHFNRCALVAYGRNRYTDESLRPLFDYPADWSPRLHEQRRRMLHFCLPPQPSLFFRRQAVALSGALASPILDYELWLRWQRDLPFFFIDDYLSLSRLHAEAKTVKSQRRLIQGICEVVHGHYLTVPYSWTFKLAQSDLHGSRWTTGEVPPETPGLRARALLYWLYYNLRWCPRTLAAAVRSAVGWVRESLHGHV
jgi:glycosyltransferase involved in cell wall biosynthesis